MKNMTDTEYRQSVRAWQLESLNLKQFTKSQINMMDIYKRELAEKAGLNQEDLAFDTALPQLWLDAFVRETGLNYQSVLSTTFALYSVKHNIHGLIWSVCKEVDDLINQ